MVRLVFNLIVDKQEAERADCIIHRGQVKLVLTLSSDPGL